MAKSEKQKLKLLYLAKLLWERSDEEHPVSMKEILEYLAGEGITAERKSIYSDIEFLKEFGWEIENNPSKKNGGYYLISRTFELPELKILVDMIQSSRFLTIKKSRSLIKKLETMTSEYEAMQLQRTVFVAGRAKSENETVYYSVDELHRAIGEDHSITFQYQDYDSNKAVKLRKGGALYHISPYHLVWNNEFYYLVGVDEELGEIRHYRVDRMKKIMITEQPRTGKELFADFDLANYVGATFGMFGGEKRSVRLVCQNNMAGVIIDRFGSSIQFRPQPDRETFTTRVDVVPSQQFFGWVAGLGGKILIDSPEDVKDKYKEYLQGLLKAYE